MPRRWICYVWDCLSYAGASILADALGLDEYEIRQHKSKWAIYISPLEADKRKETQHETPYQR